MFSGQSALGEYSDDDSLPEHISYLEPGRTGAPDGLDKHEWREATKRANAPLKSTVTVKEINGNEYYYLQWRDGDTIKSEYLIQVSPSVSTGRSAGGNYGPNWPEARSRRRRVDEHRCQSCGVTDAEHIQEYNSGLHVHHIRPRTDFMDESGVLDYEKANAIDNLITLCCECHPSYEGVIIDARI